MIEEERAEGRTSGRGGQKMDDWSVVCKSVVGYVNYRGKHE
jgi:hypothetical protein